jgi:hypothetical protein
LYTPHPPVEGPLPLDAYPGFGSTTLRLTARVALFVTCFNDTLFPGTGRAVVELLERLGPLGKLPVPGWSGMRDLPEVPDHTSREWWRDRAR